MLAPEWVNGNRFMKLIKPRDISGVLPQNQWTYTYYVRDASGNIMTTYTRQTPDGNTEQFKVDEFNMYGSSRLGVKVGDKILPLAEKTGNSLTLRNTVANNFLTHYVGDKRYELTNHLGNVMVVVSDKKIPVYLNPCNPCQPNQFSHYTAEVVAAQDYYPFGSPMPGRSFSSNSYRFGFNGMEKDDELKGTGNSHDFGARIYDSRLGRWWSIDPIRKNYPNWSPYNFSLNNPILYRDRDGGVVTDEKGNIIFTATTKERNVLHTGALYYDPSTGNYYGYQYKSIGGYILDDKGNKVQVEKSTSKEVKLVVYKESSVNGIGVLPDGTPVGVPKDDAVPEMETPAPNTDGAANCIGVSFVNGKFVIASNIEVTKEFLSNEGYKEIKVEDAQKGDIGLYYKDGVVQHGERFEEGGKTVTSKGGVATYETGKDPGKNWDPTQFDNYKVITKTQDNTKTTVSSPSINNGVNTVSAEEFEKTRNNIINKTPTTSGGKTSSNLNIQNQPAVRNATYVAPSPKVRAILKEVQKKQ